MIAILYRRRLISWLRRGWSLLVMAGWLTVVIYIIGRDWDRVAEALAGHVDWLGMGLAIVCSVLAFLSSAIGWTNLLNAVSVPVSAPQGVSIWFRSQVAKYVPGSVWPYVARVQIGRAYDLPVVEVAASCFLETALTVLCPALVVLLTIGRWRPMLSIRSDWIFIASLCGLALFVIALALLPRLSQSAGRVPWKWISKHLVVVARARRIPILQGAALYCASVIVAGFGLDYVALAVGKSAAFEAVEMVMYVAVAKTVGFVVPGAPSGLGVTEGVLALFLAQNVDVATAVLISLLYRVTLVIGEVITVGFAIAFYHFRGPSVSRL
jgi:glycosyltransferase 2 family protein